MRVTGLTAGAELLDEPDEPELGEAAVGEGVLCEPLVRVLTGAAADAGLPDAADVAGLDEAELCERLVRVVTPLAPGA